MVLKYYALTATRSIQYANITVVPVLVNIVSISKFVANFLILIFVFYYLLMTKC